MGYETWMRIQSIMLLIFVELMCCFLFWSYKICRLQIIFYLWICHRHLTMISFRHGKHGTTLLSSSMHRDIIFPLMIEIFQFLTLSNMSYVQGDIIFPLMKWMLHMAAQWCTSFSSVEQESMATAYPVLQVINHTLVYWWSFSIFFFLLNPLLQPLFSYCNIFLSQLMYYICSKGINDFAGHYQSYNWISITISDS